MYLVSSKTDNSSYSHPLGSFTWGNYLAEKTRNMRTVLIDTQVYAEHILAIIAPGKYIWKEVILVETAWADI